MTCGDGRAFTAADAPGTKLQGPTKDIRELDNVPEWKALLTRGDGGEAFAFTAASGQKLQGQSARTGLPPVIRKPNFQRVTVRYLAFPKP